MENVLFNELVSRGYSVDVGVVDVLDRNRSGKVVRKRYEIDFVVNAGFNKVYVQSAYSLESKGKVGQERNPLIKSGDFFSKIIVEYDGSPDVSLSDKSQMGQRYAAVQIITQLFHS